MYEEKQNIFEILSSIDGLKVFQVRPEIIEDMPCVTFYISSSVPDYSFPAEIGRKNCEVAVDIWGKTSSQTTAILQQVEPVMRANGYTLQFNLDVQDPDEKYSHLSTRFVY